jgi:hypothetical protein
MTILSLPRLAARPRRWPALTRRSAAACHPARRERRTYRDSFFADPAAVEDDSRRMSRPGHRS